MVALTTGLQWCLLDDTIYSVWPTNGSESVSGASTARVRLSGMVSHCCYYSSVAGLECVQLSQVMLDSVTRP